MTSLTSHCPKCRQPKAEAHYLCRPCWFELPRPTREALWRHDRLAATRLRELYRQIQQEVPLSEITVTA